MRSKLLVILTTLTFSVYSVAYSHNNAWNEYHSGEGCHETTYSDFHCHPSQSGITLDDNTAFIIAGVLLVACAAFTYWTLVMRNNSLLFDIPDTPDTAYRYLNQLPTQIPVNTSLTPRFNFNRQEHNGWKFQASFTFRF